MKKDETLPLCDLCGEHHEMLVDEKRDECPEAWAVEHLKQYESMYLKWCKSESKIQDLEDKLAEAVEVLEQINRFFIIGEASSCHEVEELINQTLAQLSEQESKGEKKNQMEAL